MSSRHTFNLKRLIPVKEWSIGLGPSRLLPAFTDMAADLVWENRRYTGVLGQQPGDVAARSRQAREEAATDRILRDLGTVIRRNDSFAQEAEAVTRPMTNASTPSRVWVSTNLTANPPAKWRTTRPMAFPTARIVPILGTVSAEIAAPETDISITKHVMMLPSCSISVVYVFPGIKRA